jgi:hypothetical protein
LKTRPPGSETGRAGGRPAVLSFLEFAMSEQEKVKTLLKEAVVYKN